MRLLSMRFFLMRFLTILAAVLLGFSAAARSQVIGPALPDGPDSVAGRVVVLVAESALADAVVEQRLLAASSVPVRAVERCHRTELSGARRPYGKRIYVLAFDEGIDAGLVADACLRDSLVLVAEPQYVAYETLIPSDSLFAEQWGLHNAGQTGGMPDADIDAPEAWDLTMGSAEVVIALIDTGVDLDHEDLIGRLLPGWDAVDGDTLPEDVRGHGTMMAGIIGASTDNGLGIAGTCPHCSILPIRAGNETGRYTYERILLALEYAVGNPANLEGVPENPYLADVISMSFGGSETSGLMLLGLGDASAAGAILVAAAGNSGDDEEIFPAAYANVISVAATDSRDARPLWSCYGEWVDIAAPGVLIRTTSRGSSYAVGSGTSASAPYVSGIAGLLLATPDAAWLTQETIRQVLIATSDPVDGFPAIVGGRVNARAALEAVLTPQACCLGSGCSLLSGPDCAAAGGLWLGGAGGCDPNPCLPAACCVEGECTLLTYADCAVAGGEWPGRESCEEDPCVEQACCVGQFCRVLREEQCVASGGTWQDAASACDPNPCVPSPCCTGEECRVLAFADCLAAGGAWEPELASCDPNPCVPVPCCVAQLCQLATLSECLSLGGVWLDGEEACEPNPCIWYACCHEGNCFVGREEQCSEAGGVWQEGFASCDPDPCNARPCCLGQECQIVMFVDCAASGGVWEPRSPTCDPNPCAPAPCCIAEVCQPATLAECLAMGGAWIGSAETCEDHPCARYACCYETTCFIAREDECAYAHGIWVEGVAGCDPNPCLPRACCAGEECALLDLASCNAMGGSWSAQMQSCDPNPCLPAVCCLADDCRLLAYADCAAAGGSWVGGDRECRPGRCMERACCLGEECRILRPDECIAQGGEWLSQAAGCDPNICAMGNDSRLYDGVLIVHAPPEAQYTSGQDWCGLYDEQYRITGSDEQVTRLSSLSADHAIVWYVIAGWSDPKIWRGVAFGFGPYDAGCFGFIDWGACNGGGYLEHTEKWPCPGEGVAILHADHWSGNYEPIGWFAGYAYESGRIPLVQQEWMGFSGFVNEAFAQFDIACLGSLGILIEGLECHPVPNSACCLDGQCLLLSEKDCALQGGIRAGSEEACDPNPCLSDASPDCATEVVLEGAAPRIRPNPFCSSALIDFLSPPSQDALRTRVAIFDVTGRCVRLLLSRDLPAGLHQVEWDGRDDAGRPVRAGVYLCRYEAGSRTAAARVTLVR